MNAIILAYKHQEKMKSATPAYLHDLLDKPMIEYALQATAEYNTTLVVADEFADKYAKYKDQATIVTTTDDKSAYTTVANALTDEATIIIDGNVPMLDAFALQDFLEGCQEDGGKIITLEQESADYQLIYLASNKLTQKCKSFDDLLKLKQVIEFEIPESFDAINPIKNRFDLSMAEDNIREEILIKWLHEGVSIKNMGSVTIGPDVEIGQETIIYPNTYITGKVSIGESCKLGPFLRIRQSATLGDGVKLGNFVELKNAKLGEKSASAHLSYLGDCTIGAKVNVGCGVITVNYDGANKHHTTIEDDAFIGCNVNLVAPITIGESALVAAGSTVTKDVPSKTLSFARARQVNKEGYERKRKQ